MYLNCSIASTLKQNTSSKNSPLSEDSDFLNKTTTKRQKRKAVAELVSGEFEASVAENMQSENLIAGPSKTLRIDSENLNEIKTSLRNEVMSDLTKMLVEKQKEMLKLMAPRSKKQPIHPNIQDSDFEPENISVARTSTPVKTNMTSSKITPSNSRNMVTGVLNDSTNQPAKRPSQQRAPSEQSKDCPSTSKILFAPQPQTFPSTNLFPMPKALTVSLPVFDGKSENFERFKDLF